MLYYIPEGKIGCEMGKFDDDESIIVWFMLETFVCKARHHRAAPLIRMNRHHRDHPSQLSLVQSLTRSPFRTDFESLLGPDDAPLRKHPSRIPILDAGDCPPPVP